MESEYDWLRTATGSDGNVEELASLANKLETAEDLHTAATAIDRAFGLDPQNAAVGSARQRLLDRLSVAEHGITFRYIPAGSYLMGSEEGDADERPVHPVRLTHYWISETPISWARYCELMGWQPPPVGMPKEAGQKSMAADLKTPDKSLWHLGAANKIRLQYCEDKTLRARDWHSHAPAQNWKRGKSGEVVSSRTLFGQPERATAEEPWGYDAKPMVCVDWEDAQRLCVRLSGKGTPQKASGPLSWLTGVKKSAPPKAEYRLPTEAEWEKAARGGLIGRIYPWGNTPPTAETCDFNRFDEFSIRPMKSFSANSYGVYAMSGCVWEWTADWYDAEFYSQSASFNPQGPAEGKKRVARGGSWADCAEAVTVSFRMAMGGEGSPSAGNPNIGFRLCRVEA
jgi:formylglycine-generating enzyme required for sulfatase activity